MKRLFRDRRTSDEKQEDRDRIIELIEDAPDDGLHTHIILNMLTRRRFDSSHRQDLRSTLDELEKLGTLVSISNINRKKGRRWQLASLCERNGWSH